MCIHRNMLSSILILFSFYICTYINFIPSCLFIRKGKKITAPTCSTYSSILILFQRLLLILISEDAPFCEKKTCQIINSKMRHATYLLH